MHALRSFVFATVLLLSGAADAAKLIAVLPLDVTHAKKKLDADGQASLEEMLRDVATDSLANDGWTVLATQNMLQTLRDNGVDTDHCGEGDCPLTAARELKAEKFISGAVQWVEGGFTASVRLIDTTTGRIQATESIEGDSVRGLRKDFRSKADDFFRKSGMLGNAAIQPAVKLPLETGSPARSSTATQPHVRSARSSSTPSPWGRCGSNWSTRVERSRRRVHPMRTSWPRPGRGGSTRQRLGTRRSRNPTRFRLAASRSCNSTLNSLGH